MSLADHPMSTRQALLASKRSEPNALETTIATQRRQIADQLGIMRAALDGDDFDLCATAAGHVSSIARALHENLEMQAMSGCTVKEAPDERLLDEIMKRIAAGETGTKKAFLAAAKKLQAPKKEHVRGRS